MTLVASQSVESALKSMSKLLGEDLPLDTSFFDNLLNQTQLGGSVMIDLTFGARISKKSVGNQTEFGKADLFLQVNNFRATAFLKASSLDMAFPLSLSLSPGGLSENYALTLALVNGYFNMDAHVSLDTPRNISQLSGAFHFTGSLDAKFPVELAANFLGNNLGFTLRLSDSDIFDMSSLNIAYDLDTCLIVNELKYAVANITSTILVKLSSEINDVSNNGLSIDVNQVTEPLVDYVNTTLGNFSILLGIELAGGCDPARRFLQGRGTNSSLADRIKASIKNLNSSLKLAGITIVAIIEPYFDSKEFAVGVDTFLLVEFDQVWNLFDMLCFSVHYLTLFPLFHLVISQSASSMIDFVKSFLSGVMESNSSSLSTIGLNNSSKPIFTGLQDLANNTSVSASFDAMLRLGVSLKVRG